MPCEALEDENDSEQDEINDGCMCFGLHSAFPLIYSQDTALNTGGPSLYNEGKGIKMTIVFTPLPPAETAQKRARKNAKPTTTSVIEHFHEDMPLADVIVKILFVALKRNDLIEHSCLWHDQEPDETDSFSLSYTIPRRVTNPVRINKGKDFEQLLHKATRSKPHEVKFYIVENKVRILPTAPWMCSLISSGSDQGRSRR